MADQEEIKEDIKDPIEHNEEKNEEQSKEKEKDKEEEKEVEFVNETKSEHKVIIDPNLTTIEVIVRGTIEWGEFNEADGVCCTYEIVTGDAWVKERGVTTGTSQHSYKSFNSKNRLVWNFPFENYYKSTDPIGWPQLVLSFTGKDFFGREIVCGYGCTHIPVKEGKFTKHIPIFSPVSSSWVVRFYAWILGKNAEFNLPSSVLAKGEGREVVRVKSEGLVKVSFDVLLRNFNKVGFEI